MIRVLKGKVKAFGEYHGVGDVIKGLSKQDEARLISLGAAEYVRKLKPELPAEPDNEEEQEKVQGEEQEEEQEGTEVDPAAEINFNPEDCIVNGEEPSKKQKAGKKSGKK